MTFACTSSRARRTKRRRSGVSEDFAVAKEQAACMSEKLYVGPATKGVTLSDKAKSRMPWGEDGSVAKLARIDWEVSMRGKAIVDTWNKEVARKSRRHGRGIAHSSKLIADDRLVKRYGDSWPSRDLALGRAGRVPGPPRAQRLRKDDAAADHRRVRRSDLGQIRHRWRAHERRAAQSPSRKHQVPELRPVSAFDRCEQRCVRSAPQGRPAARRAAGR